MPGWRMVLEVFVDDTYATAPKKGTRLVCRIAAW